MDRQQFLLHFSFLDFRSCISEAQYLIDVPASLSLDDVKREIANCHKKLHREAKYVKELELSKETELTEEDRALAADTNANNPYYDAPELPESLLGYVCDCNKTWSFSRSKGYFNLIDGVWVNR